MILEITNYNNHVGGKMEREQKWSVSKYNYYNKNNTYTIKVSSSNITIMEGMW